MDEHDLAEELQHTKDDADEWGDPIPDPDVSRSKKRLASMVSIRLADDELEVIQQRAKERGQSVSAYLRELVTRDAAVSGPMVETHSFGVSISTADTYALATTTPSMLLDGSRLTTLGG